MFEFDDSVINSAAYRRAYHTYTIKARQTSNSEENEQDEKKGAAGAKTIANLDPTDLLVIRDEDYFDDACLHLCQRIQQWVLRFSKISDKRGCRLTGELSDDKVIDRLESAVLDGSDVDSYLVDRIKRRDIFTSVVVTMMWEFIFTRYLFGLDREHRQKLKSLENILGEGGGLFYDP